MVVIAEILVMMARDVYVWRRDLRMIEIHLAEGMLVQNQYPHSSTADAGILGPHCTNTPTTKYTLHSTRTYTLRWRSN